MTWLMILSLAVAAATLVLAALSTRQLADEWYELRRGLDR